MIILLFRLTEIYGWSLLRGANLEKNTDHKYLGIFFEQQTHTPIKSTPKSTPMSTTGLEPTTTKKGDTT